MKVEEPRLEERDGALVLVGNGMVLAPDLTGLARRIEPQRLPRELVVRAAKLRGGCAGRTAVDMTAGLGEDALLLAAAGFNVVLFERDAVIAALLRDALQRAAQDFRLVSAVCRMRLIEGDSITGITELGERPDVVLLDPMFPKRVKSASVKKKLQLLQMLEAPAEDEASLLAAALSVNPVKVVVKRPAKGACLAGAAPSYSIEGKAVRYDCYLTSGA